MNPQPCHCGALILEREDQPSRGLCADCDSVRCDAYPGACNKRGHARAEHDTQQRREAVETDA